ncbi:hypothetical protein CSPX01_10970 [Colletotrichum filicis]|nr:hypothetical protein CSPX01_10970 [Colletotrichum filicis]
MSRLGTSSGHLVEEEAVETVIWSDHLCNSKVRCGKLQAIRAQSGHRTTLIGYIR